jgi:cyclopropane fatty-acyl-phospholipid synthase-like methyltransferase
MITYEQIPDFYDWLSRYVQLANWLACRDRFAGFTMHKTLAAPDDESKAAGLSYVNERLLHLVAPTAGDRILDAGCGFGGTIFHWQVRAGGTYDGLTLSRVQLDVARREAQRRALGHVCRFHLRSYDQPVDAEYDVVVAVESLIHSPDLTGTVANLRRGLRPGGTLAILDDMAEGDLDQGRPAEAELLRRHWGCATYPSADAYRHAIMQAGLVVVHEEDLSSMMRPRSREVLDHLHTRYARLHRLFPVRPVRTVVSAYLGGIALERLHGSGDVHYRLLLAREDA